MSKIDKAVQWAIDTAKNNVHGYSQANRWGADYDCSSFVISAWEQAGVPVKTYGATYTGNMYQVFLACGFEDVTNQISFPVGRNLQKGDVLLNHAQHTCMYIGDGLVVNARTDTDGVSGDSHGDEIRIQPYWDFRPWNAVLRYKESESVVDSPVDSPSEKPVKEQLLPNNSKGLGIAMLQGGLQFLGYNLGRCGIDGDAGFQNSYTNIALKQAVSAGKITTDTVDFLSKIK